jgi:hypothetical protein
LWLGICSREKSPLGKGCEVTSRAVSYSSHCINRVKWQISPSSSPRLQNLKSAWQSWRQLYAVIRMLRSGALLNLIWASDPAPWVLRSTAFHISLGGVRKGGQFPGSASRLPVKTRKDGSR